MVASDCVSQNVEVLRAQNITDGVIKGVIELAFRILRGLKKVWGGRKVT